MNAYDAIIIGAGHNGLVAGCYLAKAGKRVLVLERRSTVGGTLATSSFDGADEYDAVWPGGHLRPSILKDLDLAAFGYPAPSNPPPFISLLPDSDSLVLPSDSAAAAESIRPFSEKDARRWPEFVAFMHKAAALLDSAYSTIMPRLPRGSDVREMYGLLELGLDLRLAGRREMMTFVRGMLMTAQEFAEEWFESEPLKAAIASLGVHGVTLGPLGAGSGFNLVHNWLNRGGLAHSNVGRSAALAKSLAAAFQSLGGEIRTDVEVARILVDTYTCIGVSLAHGEDIRAAVVLSSADPRRTLLGLVGPLSLPPEFVWKTQSIKMRGSAAKVHLLTDGRHGLPEGTLVIAPTIRYLERAYDAAKYGGISESPYLEVTTSGPVVSIHFQYAPFALKGAAWSDRRAAVENWAISTLAAHFPALTASIQKRVSLMPSDLEASFALTEGDLNHGQLMLDQVFFMRPIPGWSDHRTPVDNLFLCGSGVHGGGGISGASGRNAAWVVLHP